jgi:hypothetical protein
MGSSWDGLVAVQRALAEGKDKGPFWPQPALPNNTSASTLAQKTCVRVMAISGVRKGDQGAAYNDQPLDDAPL